MVWVSLPKVHIFFILKNSTIHFYCVQALIVEPMHGGNCRRPTFIVLLIQHGCNGISPYFPQLGTMNIVVYYIVSSLQLAQ